MIERWLTGILGALIALGAPAAAQVEDPDLPRIAIGYLELEGDPRYAEDHAYARIQLRPEGRPYPGAQVAIGEAEMIGQVIGITFDLERARGGSVAEITDEVRAWVADGRRFVLADLPAEALVDLADAVPDAFFLNVAATESRLRGEACRANVVHTIPSVDMMTDALVQYLSSKRWLRILVLEGPLEADAEMVVALRHSAAKFGAQIVDVRPFLLTNDPRAREQSNVALMTAGADHDVVFVADTDGEFGRYVPYQTNRPRPVVGTTGLVPAAWHWSWERHGAPQLNSRFETLADWRMGDRDWSSWIAVKAIVQSALRTQSAEFDTVRDYLLGDRLNLDAAKGNPTSVRSWDHQLRQPILLATQNAVIERTPIPGFLHAVNDLDTLGRDAPETQCRF
jgi:ABC transporter substrate binding protein (PQQ-dependent alcohol dehydrogenase system)